MQVAAVMFKTPYAAGFNHATGALTTMVGLWLANRDASASAGSLLCKQALKDRGQVLLVQRRLKPLMQHLEQYQSAYLAVT